MSKAGEQRTRGAGENQESLCSPLTTRLARPIAVDLFAGAGGMTLGFEQAGFDVLAAVEIDPIHCATHEFNFPFWSILCKSVVDIKGEEIRKGSAIGDREIDVVCGGSPCQGFSIIGKRVLDDPRNSLLSHFCRLVLELRPKFFVLENVPGLTIGQHQQLLKALIGEFKLGGYEVEENYRVLNAAHYGVPQARKRLFLFGCRHPFKLPQYPQPLTLSAKPRQSKCSHLSHLSLGPTVWEAIADLPEPEKYSELYHRDWVVAEYGKPSNYAAVLRSISFSEDDYAYKREYDPRLLSASLRTKHTAESIERFRQTPLGQREKISRFHKLHPDGVCITLRAGTDKHRSSFTSPRPIHPYTPRCITVREGARLHSYPDWFRFHLTKWHGFRQVGNSVPPLLAKAIAAEIIRALGVSPSKPTFRQKLGDEKLLQFKISHAAQYYGIELDQVR